MNLSRAQQVFVGVAILAILGAVAIGLRGRYVKARSSVPAEVYTPPAAPALPATITVYVAGAVRSPGLRALPRGARVNDALTAAGGCTPDADTAHVNPAAPLDDGQRIDIPFRAPPAMQPPVAPEPSKPPPSQPARRVNIHAASPAELESLPGIGPGLAQAIVDYRHRVGGFRQVEDLAAVPGIGPKRLAEIRPFVTVQ